MSSAIQMQKPEKVARKQMNSLFFWIIFSTIQKRDLAVMRSLSK